MPGNDNSTCSPGKDSCIRRSSFLPSPLVTRPAKNWLRNHRWTGALLLLGVLLISGMAVPLKSAHAAAFARTDMNNLAVRYADSHWNWDWWDPNNHGTVNAGDGQPDFQCAEFVARALSAEGVIPGLGPFSPQSSYLNYTALNGKTYDLLYIGQDLPNLYQYLIDTGQGTDIGNNPANASPGDAVVYYDSTASPTRTHVELLVQTGSTPGGTDTLVDGHNVAEHHDIYYGGASNITPSIIHIKFPHSYAAAIESLASPISSTPYVSAELGFSGPLNGELRARSSSVGPWELFIVVDMGNGRVAFLSAANGLYVSAELGYASPTTAMLRARSGTAGAWEQYIINRSNLTIQSTANNLCVAAELGAAYTGNDHGMLRARTNCSSAGDWESFSIIQRAMP